METLNIRRYPASGNKSLRPWSAADEYLLKHFSDLPKKKATLAIYGDRFGFLTCHTAMRQPLVIVEQASQQYAIEQNKAKCHIQGEIAFQKPLLSLPKNIDQVLMNVPKSLDLFRLYLYHITANISKDGRVEAAFMTRHFTPKLLSIAKEFFGEVEQSLAWKKSRLLLLKKPLAFRPMDMLTDIAFGDKVFRQYLGVFSAGHIDYASQFFIQHLTWEKSPRKVLDLASGNGVLAWAVQQKIPNAELHLMDDSYLAVESSKHNLGGEQIHFHHAYDLAHFPDEYFDLIVSNPPFHFGHEIDISLPLGLFKGAARCLASDGEFQLVSNRHLNYGKALKSIFKQVETVAMNDKFEVLVCRK